MSGAPPTAAGVRAEAREWLEAHWDPDRPLLEWRGVLADSGWASPQWPFDWYGRGLSSELVREATDERQSFGAVGPPIGSAMSLAAPTLLAHGSDELKRRLLRRILTGEDRWCQLFSEPGNGSDLAGLTTRAERDGDEWVVSGQKVWTTGAKTASFGMLLARTDWDAPKHRGITYFVLPMDQPGVEVRPLRQMNGHASFNEVFFTEARVPADNLVGEVNDGWSAALTTLAHERGLGGARLVATEGWQDGRTAREAMAEASEYARTYAWYPQRAGRADLLVEVAREIGASGVERQLVADVIARTRVASWNVERGRAARAAGRPPGPEGSVAKLAGSDIARRSANAHATMAGAAAMLTGPSALRGGIIAEILISVPAGSIAGGTDEIQHNIVGERSLGLPREPSSDSQVPFREVQTNSPRR
jgi:alkylation response protein AidB-like acyl-CoA dehydrogenase